MRIVSWKCDKGHVLGQIEDEDNTASEVAIKVTRKRFDPGGCDNYSAPTPQTPPEHYVRCRAKVTEHVRDLKPVPPAT